VRKTVVEVVGEGVLERTVCPSLGEWTAQIWAQRRSLRDRRSAQRGAACSSAGPAFRTPSTSAARA
jgi:hypothetical protein